MTIVWDIVLVVALTLGFVIVLGVFARRVLGTRIGTLRLAIAGLLGLAAEFGFESQVIWRRGDHTPAFIPLQIGIVFLVAVAFLVVAEVLAPAGSLPRPDQWRSLIGGSVRRGLRYAQISRIAVRHRLIPFAPDSRPTAAGGAERSRQAAALRTALETAGGAFVKLGQLLSTRSDLMPDEFRDELARLQQNVPASPWPQVRELLEEELAGPLEASFTEFEPDPLAAASIGQVHAARLHDGRRVAVKVQRPGIASLVERDLDIVTRLSRRLERTTDWGRRLGVSALAEGFVEALRAELDYTVEARNMAAMAATQARHAPTGRVRIPDHVPRLCTGKVLVMELVDGETLGDRSALLRHSRAERESYATELLRSLFVQIVDDGVFHADLHPGNIMVDRSGRLVLLDFGSVGRLDPGSRAQIGRLLDAFYRGDADTFTDALLGFAQIPGEVDDAALRRRLGVFLVTHLGPGAVLDATVLARLVRLLSQESVALSPEPAAALRAVGTLEGTVRLLSPGFDLLGAARTLAQERVSAGMRPGAVFTGVADELAAVLPLLRRLPRRVDRLLAILTADRFQANVRLFADRRDRTLVRGLVNLVVIAFLAGVFAIVAVLLLVNAGGPRIAGSLTLFEIFGYLLGIVSAILTLRVLFDAFRLRPKR